MDSVAKNIAVIGCGYWGQSLVRNMAEIGALCALSDNEPKRLADFSAKYDVPGQDYEKILSNGQVEGIVLATPAVSHADMAVAALKAGKHVFVEKPIALTLDDADRMTKAANSAGRKLMVGHLLQYHPVFLHLKDMAAQGALGALRYLYSNRLNFGKIRTEENVFWSFAPHDISMILALAGRLPEKVDAVYSSSLPSSPASTATAFFDFGQNLNAHIHVSWLNPFKEQKLVVVGDKAMAVFDDTQPWDRKLAVYNNSVRFDGGQPILDKADAVYPVIAQSEPLKNECLHFAACVANDSRPRTDGVEGTNVLKVLHACDQAAAEKRA